MVSGQKAAARWSKYLDKIRKSHNSTGAVIEVQAINVPPGLGAPIYGKLDMDIAAALMSINAVKGVEIGEGMQAAALTGSENADEIFIGDNGSQNIPLTMLVEFWVAYQQGKILLLDLRSNLLFDFERT